MPVTQSVQNNFIAGLKTEATGLNFPENAWINGNNVVPSLIGDVYRREGINYEQNYELFKIDSPPANPSAAKASYRWRNVGGDGQTEIIVIQRGNNLYFYISSNATTANPLSNQLIIGNIINIGLFQAVGNTNNVGLTECTFSDGNGFLFVYHKDIDTFYCTYNAATTTVSPFAITLKVRDLVGIPETGVADNFRPTTLTNEHTYNLRNQGWTFGSPWSGSVTANFGPPAPGGSIIGASWTLPILSQTNTSSLTNGSQLNISGNSINGGGFTQTTTILATVTSYVTPFTQVTVTVVSCNTGTVTPDWGIYSGGTAFPNPNETLSATLVNQGFVTTWFNSQADYPSNSDVWWQFKDTTGAFNPGLMAANVQQNVSPAPKGRYLLNPFMQQRSSVSGVSGLTDITTTTRASNGCWFQGRVFYTGVNSSAQPSGDEPFYTWTENIYFSQIVETPADFGLCYQANDPTDQNLFDILPSDGGVIVIQGSGAIYKLFPMENGLLVFASNGIWFITGSQGINFTATDYAIRQISKVQCLSPYSFISVNGMPMFWNEEGIYAMSPTQFSPGLNANATAFQVNNLAVGNILTFYQNIPKQSKIFARGDYDPVNFIITWVYRSTQETSITNRYNDDSALSFNIVNKAFYTYSFPSTFATIVDIRYVAYPGASGINVPNPTLKYIIADPVGNLTFAEERDATYVDFISADPLNVGTNFSSFFIAGYNLAGKGLLKFQPIYLQLYLRNNVNNSYKINPIWDYSISGHSGKQGTVQKVVDTTSTANFGFIRRRHRMQGRGVSFSFQIQSVNNQPFDIIGWTIIDNLLQSV